MDAQTLFREGVLALRDKHDTAQAQRLLAQSLKLDPKNDMAWLWLSRTTNDPQRKLQCAERALAINPQNVKAMTLRAKLLVAQQSNANTMDWRARLDAINAPVSFQEPEIHTAPNRELPPEPPAASLPTPPKLKPQQQELVDQLLEHAESLIARNDVEGALEEWGRVLDLQVDHPVAMQKAVRYLFKLDYQDVAHDLIWQAISAGTTSVPIYLTGIDIARYQADQAEGDDLRERVALLPNADEDLIEQMVDYFLEESQPLRASDILERTLPAHPDSQKLLLKTGYIYEKVLDRKKEAMLYYERAARIKSGSKAGKTAEKALRDFTPVMTDRERGSTPLALREAVGFGALFLLLGWQDAGLNLLHMGASRWLGVGLSILGGYLVVTALSSPQQQPLAAWLGGHVPENPPPPPQKRPALYEETPLPSGVIQEPTSLPILPAPVRALFALAGTILLIGAFALVFSMSIQLIQHPVEPFLPSIYDLITETVP